MRGELVQFEGLREVLADLVYVNPLELVPGELHQGLEYLNWRSGFLGRFLRLMINEGDVNLATAETFLELMLSFWARSLPPGIVPREGQIVPAEADMWEGAATYCVDKFSDLLLELVEDLPNCTHAVTGERTHSSPYGLSEDPNWRFNKAASAKCLLILGQVARRRRDASRWFEVELRCPKGLLETIQLSLPEHSVAGSF